MIGTIVRMITFQSLVSDNGITGWKFSVHLKPSLFGPRLNSKLFWKGTLMSELIGLASSFTSSSSLFSWAKADGNAAPTITARIDAITFPDFTGDNSESAGGQAPKIEIRPF